MAASLCCNTPAEPVDARWWWAVGRSLNTQMKSCYIICTAKLGSPSHQHWSAKTGKGFPVHAVRTHSHMCAWHVCVWGAYCVSTVVFVLLLCVWFLWWCMTHLCVKVIWLCTNRGAAECGYCVCVFVLCLWLSVHLPVIYPLMTISPFLRYLHGLNMTVPFRLDRRPHYNKPALYWGQIDFGQSLVY